MPFFTYEGQRADGQPVNGRIQATDGRAALALLAQQGIRARLTDPNSPPASTSGAVRPATATPRPAVAPIPPAARPSGSPTVARTPVTVPATAAPVVIHDVPVQRPRIWGPRGTDKERMFLFSQLAAQFNSGYNPAQGFAELIARSPAKYHDALRALAAAASEGSKLAPIMARYPDLFPEDVVGLIGAGEEGGFLPAAAEEVARHAEENRKFRRFFWWIWAVVINVVFIVPVALWIGQGLVKTWEEMERTGGAGDGFKVVGQTFGEVFTSVVLPICVISAITLWVANRIWTSRRFTSVRHRFAAYTPVIGRRARYEGLSRFAWTLALLARGGMPPNHAWPTAAATVPNRAIRDQILRAGAGMTERDRLSGVLKARLFPIEYSQLVETAEYTGDTSGTLQKLADLSYSDFTIAQKQAKFRGGCWGFLAMGIAAAVAYGIVMYYYFYVLMPKVVGVE